VDKRVRPSSAMWMLARKFAFFTLGLDGLLARSTAMVALGSVSDLSKSLLKVQESVGANGILLGCNTSHAPITGARSQTLLKS